MKPDNLENFEDLLPDGALPVCGFRLLSYITDSGRTHYVFSQVGDVAVSQLVGLMEIVKTDIATSAIIASRGEEKDDE
jgi:hypothetical protein